MPRYTGYFSVLLLVWMRMADAQQMQYSDPPPATDFSGLILSGLIYVTVVAVVVAIGWFIYRFYSTRDRETPHGRPEAQPNAQSAQKPISVPKAGPYVSGSVFISYRRDDSADITGRIYDRLIQHFSREIVFKDVDSIPLGIDFRQHLENALSQCRVLLAIVGSDWMGSGTVGGKRRIDDPRDHLRLELEVALARNIPVIPVLVRRASIPSEDQLPPSLRSLAYRNGIQIRPDPDFHGDMDRLIKGIEPHLTG
jgi:TIR domain